MTTEERAAMFSNTCQFRIASAQAEMEADAEAREASRLESEMNSRLNPSTLRVQTAGNLD